MSIRHPVLIAMLAMLSANIALSLNDALIKQTHGVLGLWTIFMLRSFVSLPLVVLATAVMKVPLWPQQFWGVSLRTGLLLIGWVALYSALPFLPIANATAVVYTIPIIIVCLTAVLDWRWPRWGVTAAVIVGFVGVILIARPEEGSISPAYILPIVSALTYAIAMIFSNRKLVVEHALTIAVNLNIGFLLMGTIGVLATANDPLIVIRLAVSEQSTMFLYMGLCLVVGTIGVAVAYQSAAPTLVSTVDYSYLVFAILWGVLFFAEVPSPLAMIGMGFIAVAGFLAMRRS
ncbi:MAG: DMT family transporter [Planktomarina sp.]